jgi:hypothetical protein
VPRLSPRVLAAAAPVLAALAAGVAGIAGRSNEALSGMLFFAAWTAAVLLLFGLALSLPVRIGGPRRRAALWNLLLAGAAVVVAYLANVAVFRHDVHFDLSREGVNTPPQQLDAVVGGLTTDVSLTYFYNSADENALEAKALLAIEARRNGHFRLRAVDLDKEPATARRLGVRAYNTAVLETADRRTLVENTVDLAQMAYAALRVLKKQAQTVCFVTGHGEAFSATPPHTHYSHVETLSGHDVPGSGDVVVGARDGLERLQLAVTTFGYEARAIVPAASPAIPPDCTVVADMGPRSAYAPGEAALLANYLARGGRLLLTIDPAFPVGGDMAELLGRLGLAADQAMVIDPLNHYGADPSKVAVPYYPPHPITDQLALTVFPEARPIRVGQAPDGVHASVLISSSTDSYVRPLAKGAQRDEPARSDPGKIDTARAPAIVAVAVEGRWPDAPAGEDKAFRLVLVGNSSFATNAYFPYVSNGDLAIGMVRWLAGDEDMPGVKPQSFSLPQVDLTNRQMRDIFITIELLLPLAVLLFGTAVWWMRR